MNHKFSSGILPEPSVQPQGIAPTFQPNVGVILYGCPENLCFGTYLSLQNHYPLPIILFHSFNYF